MSGILEVLRTFFEKYKVPAIVVGSVVAALVIGLIIAAAAGAFVSQQEGQEEQEEGQEEQEEGQEEGQVIGLIIDAAAGAFVSQQEGQEEQEEGQEEQEEGQEEQEEGQEEGQEEQEEEQTLPDFAETFFMLPVLAEDGSVDDDADSGADGSYTRLASLDTYTQTPASGEEFVAVWKRDDAAAMMFVTYSKVIDSNKFIRRISHQGSWGGWNNDYTAGATDAAVNVPLDNQGVWIQGTVVRLVQFTPTPPATTLLRRFLGLPPRVRAARQQKPGPPSWQALEQQRAAPEQRRAAPGQRRAALGQRRAVLQQSRAPSATSAPSAPSAPSATRAHQPHTNRATSASTPGASTPGAATRPRALKLLKVHARAARLAHRGHAQRTAGAS